jgi:hypothetical protein
MAAYMVIRVHGELEVLGKWIGGVVLHGFGVHLPLGSCGWDGHIFTTRVFMKATNKTRYILR